MAYLESDTNLSDPFSDSHLEQSQRELVADSTLVVGRNASLTLGTDSLVVLDEGLIHRRPSNLCGLVPRSSKITKIIPFFNVLWASVTDQDITIHYASPTSRNVVRVAIITYAIEKIEKAQALRWSEKLLDRAYGPAQRCKRIKVLVNPFGGQGRAAKWYMRDVEPIFAAARCEIDVEKTKYRAHAIEIAEQLDTKAWDVVACCSGDGVPYEVFNGLGKKPNALQALADIAVVQLPCGTGNAMSWNFNGTDSPSLAALCVVKGLRTPLDLASVTQGDSRTLSFLSQALGIIAESDLGTEHLRWMGDARFTYGLLKRLLRKTIWPCDIAIEVEESSKTAIKLRYRQEVGNRQSSTSPSRREFQQLQDSSSTVLDVSTPPSNSLAGLPPLQYGTVNDDLPPGWQLIPHDHMGNFYAGNMAFMAASTSLFPASLPNDGCLDLLRVQGDIPRLRALKMLLGTSNGSFFDMPEISYNKIKAYRIIPKQPSGLIAVDGESMPFEPFQVEVHKGLGTVLTKSGHLYEAEGPRGWQTAA